MQSVEEFEYDIEKCFERESDGCFARDDPRKDAAKLISDRDAEWQARVDTLLEDNARSEEQVEKQFANAVSFKSRAEKAEARVEKLEAEREALRAGFLDRALEWRGIEYRKDACPKCGGSGVVAYGSTATWMGGLGGQAITNGVCDECWGSGDITRKWADLRKLRAALRREA